MLPEDDDGSESSGPPPDPSLREWRHPSEIAAARAAAERPAAAPSRSIVGPLITFGGTALGAAVLVGVGLYLTGTGISQQATQRAVIDDPLASSTTTTLSTLARESTGGEPADGERSADQAGDTETADSLNGVDDPPTSDSVNTTTSSEAPGAATTEVTAPASTTEPVDLLAPERRPAAPPDHDGVYGLIGDSRLERLAGLVVVDDLVFTTGAAIDGRAEVALGGPDGWTTATVLGVDPVTDVAVLTIGDPAYLDHERPLAPEPGERWLGTGGPDLGNRGRPRHQRRR